MNIYFITGTSGSGKTTLMNNLKTRLPKSFFEVYDFDENGVPPNADKTWRQETTDFWLRRAQENNKHNKSTVICGVTVPTEIINSFHKPNMPIYFGFIKISDDTIKQRLQARNWDDQLIEDNINWSHYLQKEAEEQPNHIIVDSSYKTAEQVADVFAQWIRDSVHFIKR